MDRRWQYWRFSGIKPIAPRFASRWAKKGVGIRAAISVAECPFSVTEIAHATYLRLGIAAPSTREIAIAGTDLIYLLRRHFGDRLAMVEGRPRRWILANMEQETCVPI